MAPVLLTPTQISQFLQKLEAFGDQSLQVRSVIHLEKRYPFEQFQVWVDEWPQFTAALLKQKLFGLHTHNYYIFTLGKENLKNLLQNTDIVEWENAIFRVFPWEYRQQLYDAASKHDFSLICTRVDFYLYKLSAQTLKQRSIPEDVTVGSLILDMADMVTKNWSDVCMHQSKTPSYIRYLIATYPTVCVCNSKGTPVAYELGQEYGGIGILFVEPTYRRQGLGKLVTTILAQKYLDLGYQPFVGIGCDNEASIKLHLDIGFEKTDVLCGWAKCVPK